MRIPEKPTDLDGARVLVVDDDAADRRILEKTLKGLGVDTAVADSAQSALDALRKAAACGAPFRLILVDANMPDRLEAVGRIRSMEKSFGGHIPIIALTARPVKEERQGCVEAGMDGCVSKPAGADELMRAMGAAMASDNGAALLPRPQAKGRPMDGEVMDIEAALARADGDMEAIRDIASVFLKNSPSMLSAISDAIGRGDASGLNRSSHVLRGSVANFDARAAGEVALKLEMMGKNGGLSDAQEAFKSLEAEMGRLNDALEQFLAGGGDENTYS